MLVLLKVSSIFQYLKRALPCTRSCLVVFAYITPLFTAASELRSTPVSENQCAFIRRHETKLRLLNCVHKEIVNTYSERTASSTAHHNIISTNLNAESITCLFVVLWKPWFLKNLKKSFFFSIARIRILVAILVTDKPGLLFISSQKWSFEIWYPE